MLAENMKELVSHMKSPKEMKKIIEYFLSKF